ncbi:MAG: protein kinase [Phycisphaerae bacterium]|nr:protein kinase [Phycisphaerae bacterium]
MSVRRPAELTPQQQAAVTDHMWQCKACRRRWRLDVTNAGSRRDGGRREQPTSIDSEVSPPRDLGGFEIISRLGQGGMGTVFRARQPNMDRIVVLKVLTGDAAWNESSLARFTREAQAAAAAGHPNIIEVYDTGHDRGWHYIVMEYMDGGSLADILDRDGPLPPASALVLMRHVARGLAEAHRVGVLHRDIKPSNILLTARGWAKVADFGLAKRPDVDLDVTRPTFLLGTPAYMAPEALRGEEYDPRCDLYSLGAMFYQVFTGQPPFTGAIGTELVAKHLEAKPAPLTDVSPGTPPSLARIIHRLLEKEPSDRYQTAEDLLDALEKVDFPAVPDSGVSSSGATVFRHIGRAVGRRPKTFLLAALLFLAMIGVCVGLFVLPGVESFTPGPWVNLFDGKTLTGWRVLTEAPCDLPGKVYGRDGQIVLEQAGERSTSISWTGFTLPRTNYELKLNAMRTGGHGCLCHVVFPVDDSYCLLNVGGVRGDGVEGTVVALDRVDGFTSVDKENPTTRLMTFDDNRCYHIRLRVTRTNITVWIDDARIINLSLAKHKTGTPPPWTILQPLGLGNWESASVFDDIAIRRLEPAK